MGFWQKNLLDVVSDFNSLGLCKGLEIHFCCLLIVIMVIRLGYIRVKMGFHIMVIRWFGVIHANLWRLTLLDELNETLSLYSLPNCIYVHQISEWDDMCKRRYPCPKMVTWGTLAMSFGAPTLTSSKLSMVYHVTHSLLSKRRWMW